MTGPVDPDDDNEPLPLSPKAEHGDVHLDMDDDEEKDDHEATGPTLQVEIMDDDDEDIPEEETPQSQLPEPEPENTHKKRNNRGGKRDREEEEALLNSEIAEEEPLDDPRYMAQVELIKQKKPETELEEALAAVLERKEQHVQRLVSEISKLKGFISKRKQTYKRKRKDEGAPTRALSAYNIFIQDRFARLAKENDAALKSTDTNARLQRVPPANLVASTGNAWKLLPAEEKAKYEERAKKDRKRYEEQMAKYQPPDKTSNRKRNKTGYNMFFSAHVLRLKQSEMGVPSERGSVARLVGNAWKALTQEEKQYYEREADKHNGMNPVIENTLTKEEDDEEEEDINKRGSSSNNNTQPLNVYDPTGYAGHDMSGAAGMPYPHHHPMHTGAGQQQQHDPRHHGYYYPTTHGYYDYGTSSHHHQQPQQQSQHGGRSSRSHQQQYQYPPQHNDYYK